MKLKEYSVVIYDSYETVKIYTFDTKEEAVNFVKNDYQSVKSDMSDAVKITSSVDIFNSI